MRYGVLIDDRRCIGCHSCTVACKTENRVPLGVTAPGSNCSFQSSGNLA